MTSNLGAMLQVGNTPGNRSSFIKMAVSMRKNIADCPTLTNCWQNPTSRTTDRLCDPAIQGQAADYSTPGRLRLPGFSLTAAHQIAPYTSIHTRSSALIGDNGAEELRWQGWSWFIVEWRLVNAGDAIRLEHSFALPQFFLPHLISTSWTMTAHTCVV